MKDQVTILIVKVLKNLIYDPSKNSRDILLDNSCDPDLNFYNINIENINTPYIILENL